MTPIADDALGGWVEMTERGDEVIIHTHCMYPENGVVCVHLRRDGSGFSVHDGRGALDIAEVSGYVPPNVWDILHAAAAPQGLIVTGGRITSPLIEPAAIAGTVILVANASQRAAYALVYGSGR